MSGAEIVLAACIEREVRPHLAAVFVEKADQAAEVVIVTVADDQRLDPLGIDPKQFRIVEQRLRGVAEVEHERALFGRALRLEIK